MTWHEQRVREMADLINGFPFDSATFADQGDVPLVRIRDILSNQFQTFLPAESVPESVLLRNGDVVIGMDGDFNTIHWVRGPAALNQRLCCLRSNGRSDSRFLAYALPAHLKVINDLTYATTVKHLSSGQVKGIRLLAPDLDEQRAIADYLDRETAQIDALIAKQQRLIQVLRDRRVSVLDGIAREAGEPTTRLKYLYRESGIANHPGEEVLSVYRDYGVIPKSSRSDNFNRTPENVERYLLVQPGDLVINRMKAWQGSLGVSQHRGIVSGDYEVLRPIGDQLLPEFAHLYLRSARMVEQYKIRSTGIRPSQWRIYWAQTGMLEVPVPDMAVQHALVTRASEQTSKVDTLIAKAEQFIELALERRSALITAAVTGQIEVRGEVV
ncbi:restriction endonuclease subunit S [Mycobacterium cookii]|uniref:Restriction endonuclease subunit S n=1 Tax=Nocardioides furvisabuli TaxID=375542 RepID=A0ABN2XQ54_9ACTN|nr:restriction endonuclease subunit S [Nocardioides furvisabuli]